MTIGSLSHFVRVYDDHLDAELCERMIDSFNTMPRFQERNGRGVRTGLEDSAWVEMNVTRMADAGFVSFFRQRIDQALLRYNQDVGLAIPIPNSPRTADLILKRYRPGTGEQFQVHFDSMNDLASRFLVFLWYLNDVPGAGETAFPQLDLKVAPRRGRLLMFPPYWMYQHAGLPPESGDKYILSTYLMFTDAPQAS